ERQKVGAAPLVMDESLLESAMHRAAETVILGSHGRPDGTLCFTINSQMRAENYAWGFNSSQSVMDGWMGSPGHKANILNGEYKGIGVGVIKYNGAYYWIQCFGTTSQTSDCTKPADGNNVRAINMPYNTITDPYKNIQVTFSFSISPSNKTLVIGESRDLTLKMDSVTFLDGEDSVYWRSGNEEVATIDANGVVTGLSSGTTVITASSKYLDRKSFSLNITVVPENVRVYGPNRVDTSIEAARKLKTKLGVSKFDSVIVASGMNYADALAGSWLSAVKSAPILLLDKVSEDKVAQYVKANLSAEGTVYILGGNGAVPETLEDKLAGLSVSRLSGKSRYDTNMAILEETDVSGKDLIVCSGAGYADALSVSSVGRPIMLVGTELTDAQKEYLEDAGFAKIYAVGGTAAVSSDVVNELVQYAGVTRVGGKNRFETSLNVAKTFFPGTHDHMMMVYAKDFPDGLSGGALAYQYDAPVLLATSDNVSAAVAYRGLSSAARSITMGGPKLISDNAIFTAMGNTAPIQVN
nr:cell wall-binding repeat-containing protein [Clostridia bacterium]